MPPHQPLQPIPRWKLVVGVVVVAVLTTVAVVVLWWAGTRGLEGKDLVAERLDALKVGLSIAVGSGGLFALYLGWRRQRSTEATEARQERVDADVRLDARERRITELYTKAADQLGSDKAAVRLAGLYALERLAQDTEPQRQTIVNLLCAYLRMPYRIPDDEADEANEARWQEREVRLTAQHILRRHLVADAPAFWPSIDLNLSGAVLLGFTLSGCALRYGTFSRARFVGPTVFTTARFAGKALFRHARFEGDADFTGARFGSIVRFDDAEFRQQALFGDVEAAEDIRFSGAHFAGGAPALAD